jgi:hypothetical protein
MADARKNAGKTPGRGSGRPFEKGNPGKPKGARHRITVTAEQLLAGEAEALTRRAIEMALDGKVEAMRLCLERVMPVRRGRPVKFKMPDVGTASDVVSAIGAVLRAVSEGELTCDEASTLANVLEAKRRSIELVELEGRITALEQKAAS